MSAVSLLINPSLPSGRGVSVPDAAGRLRLLLYDGHVVLFS